MSGAGPMRNTCTNRLCLFICLGCRWLTELPPGKGLFPLSFHSEGTKIHPDLAVGAMTFLMVIIQQRQTGSMLNCSEDKNDLIDNDPSLVLLIDLNERSLAKLSVSKGHQCLPWSSMRQLDSHIVSSKELKCECCFDSQIKILSDDKAFNFCLVSQRSSWIPGLL